MIHLATGAVVNALWDLWAKSVGKPVWQLVVDMTPEEYVRCVDFRYIVDAITPEEAIEMLKDVAKTKEERVKDVKEDRAVPAYTTSAGYATALTFSYFSPQDIVIKLITNSQMARVLRREDDDSPARLHGCRLPSLQIQGWHELATGQAPTQTREGCDRLRHGQRPDGRREPGLECA